VLKDPRSNIEHLFDDDKNPPELKLLEFKDGAFIVFLKRRPRPGHLLGTNITRPGGGYIISPFEISDGKIKLAFIGDRKQVREIIAGVEERGLNYKVISLTDVNLSLKSPLNSLTEKQRAILISAFKLGYCDVPRKINSDMLADHFGLRSATVVEHLRKAEKRLISAILNES
jgi:predicted DNA binding protein